jgi:hypothetical protein
MGLGNGDRKMMREEIPSACHSHENFDDEDCLTHESEKSLSPVL